MNMIGKVLGGRYEILEKIGEGGMAIVYKARCNLLNRFVAIKILKSEYSSDETFVKRFRAEAQSAASLTHPNIVSVYDVGQERDEKISYIVMELLESKTLKDYINEHEKMTNDEVLKVAAQVASALEAAHKAHIIHRDIKPHNIILNNNMVAKVTDFGIAKITNTTSATITSFGSTMGSVHYFSPEHAKGGYTDEKSDIYSLGVVMYEMATGKLPFDAESPVSVALKHIQEEPVEPIILNTKISVALNQIILKAMSKNTADRYQSATELLIDISEALAKPNSLIVKPASSIEAGATQVIPIINMNDENEFKVPNLRTREPRRMSVVQGNKNIKNNELEQNKKEDIDKYNEEQKEDIEEDKAKKAKRKKLLIIYIVCAAIAIIGIGIYAGVNIFSKFNVDKTKTEEIEIPNVVGRPFDEVVEEYSKQGIEVVQEKSDYSSDQPEGNIISQTPEKGTKTNTKRILVVVSKGQKMVKVTDVVGKDIKVVRYELESTLGFKIETEEVINEKVTAGIIITQEPKGDTELPYGSTVKLKVSKGDGKATVLVPSVLGKSLAEAKKQLEDLKLTVNVKYSEDNTKSNGVVILQSYPENQELKEGSLIDITINKLVLSKTITLDLLELQGGKVLEGVESIAVKVTASIDGGVSNSVFDKSFDPNTKEATFNIKGYTSAALKIYLNGDLVKEQTIQF